MSESNPVAPAEAASTKADPPAAAAAKPKKEKKKPDNVVIPAKKPKLSKAERRALQEQQRAAKEGGGGAGGRGAPKGAGASDKAAPSSAAPSATSPRNGPTTTSTSTNNTAAAAAASSNNTSPNDENTTQDSQHVALVSHLKPYHDPTAIFASGATLQSVDAFVTANLHPAVITLGHQYATGQVSGGNARCRAMLACFSVVIADYQPPTDNMSDVRHVLDNAVLKPAFHYWTQHCRPHSVSMGNAFSFLKAAVASLDRDMEYVEMVNMLQETMELYQKERIQYADQAIAANAVQKLYAAEVILTFGHAEVVVETLLLAAKDTTRQLRVIVVDSRPLLEGKKMLQKLLDADIECSYILLNALTYVLQDVTKVLLGASALLSDGSVWGRVGTACVALAAHVHHIPVLVMSTTYKISNKVQLEALTGNELGDPAQVSSSAFEGENGETELPENLKLLNLVYDLTPASFVSGIVTEFGIVPATSVAVLLREMNPQDFKAIDMAEM